MIEMVKEKAEGRVKPLLENTTTNYLNFEKARRLWSDDFAVDDT